MKRSGQRKWERGVYLGLALLALANGGCLLVAAGAAAGGAAALAYYEGAVCRTYAASFEDTWAATQTALTELGMPFEAAERNEKNGSLTSRLADGDKVRIHLDSVPGRFPAEGTVTRVCIRVAVFGDHPVSHGILNQIGSQLVPPGWVPPQPATPPANPSPIQQVSHPSPATPLPETAPPPLLPEEMRKP
jgi:hypothetical protein